MIHQSKANSGRFQETKKVIQYLIPYAPELPSSNPLLYFPAAEWRGRGLTFRDRIRVLSPDRRGRGSARVGGTDQVSEINRG